MKALILSLFALFALTGAEESCLLNVNSNCRDTSGTLELPSCSASYGAFREVESDLGSHARYQLDLSYDYLLHSTYFSNYKNNRLGFGKLFKKLSDEAWQKTIGIIKHITTRGGEVDLGHMKRYSPTRSIEQPTMEISELYALAKALDKEKDMAEHVHHIHHLATRNSNNKHDPEVSQYLEEELIEGQAAKIRELAGHTADLKKFISNGGKDMSLALYLFDEFLKKTV